MAVKILFGPAGSGGLGNYEGVAEVERLGLGAMEVEFTYGVRMFLEEARRVGARAKELGVALSVHAPYYINLASAEKAKRLASQRRIIESCERGALLGAQHIVFHPGYYGKLKPEHCFNLILQSVLEMQRIIKARKWPVVLCPETSGKFSAFGSVDELVALARKTGCGLCIDFAHIYAKAQGKPDFDAVLAAVKRVRHLTAHISGITYSPAGEKAHIITPPSLIRAVLSALIKHKLSLTLINESPNPFGDSVKALKIWSELTKR